MERWQKLYVGLGTSTTLARKELEEKLGGKGVYDTDGYFGHRIWCRLNFV